MNIAVMCLIYCDHECKIEFTQIWRASIVTSISEH